MKMNMSLLYLPVLSPLSILFNADFHWRLQKYAAQLSTVACTKLIDNTVTTQIENTVTC